MLEPSYVKDIACGMGATYNVVRASFAGGDAMLVFERLSTQEICGTLALMVWIGEIISKSRCIR